MIELKHLDFAYEKNHPILTDLSAKFGEAGSNVVGVIGPNGTGKSTLFRSI